ncbi:uncharacterized protein LOC122870237 [Lates japonicus]
MSVNESGAPFYHCFDSRPALLVLTAYFITKLLLLFPLYIFILYLGHQRWRQHRSLNTTSHSDIFTYNMAAVDLSSLVAYVFFFYCIDTNLPMMIEGGFYVANMVFPGEMCFHVLTCVERYLAIVHPITYRGLRQSGGVRIRNISIGCVWLLCFGWMGITAAYIPNFPMVPFLCLLVSSLFVTSACSLRVLLVLFHTVTAILTMLWFWFIGLLVCIALEMSWLLDYNEGCVVIMSGTWFSLPSKLVLPLLFLHRAGKLLC